MTKKGCWILRIARYRCRNVETYGIINNQTVVSIPTLAKHLEREIPLKLEEFITDGKKTLKKTEKMLKNTTSNDVKRASSLLSAVSLLAPIPFPPKIICLGLNYFDHASETKSSVPDEPIIFMKPHTAVTGPNQKIIKPKFVKELDYEGELCIVIGRTAKNIPVSEAKNYVFGYTIFNDVSARDFQFKDGQWTRGKSFDTFAPTGPCITIENQLRNTGNLDIRTYVNDELRQNGNTQNMIFKVGEIVHQLSLVMTLEPCDIIATGTPAGVGFALKPPHFLKHGDVVRIEIEGIGSLENSVEEIG